ncbi:MAG TPA: hypothetical protein VE046_06480 [Steroidobacteraceae bacterium]|nr:hypothetical protein [Steroidobacteraceae bacterium]
MTSAQRGTLALVFTAACAVAVFFAPAFGQPPSYHDFADRRALLGVPNFGDVASNLPFLAVGVAGLWAIRRGGRAVFIENEERWPYVFFFVGVLLTAFGSSCYHLAPGNGRLVWDRLPITMAFMGLIAALVADRVSVRFGRTLTLPAVVVGLASVWYWQWTAARGAENLMPYLILQGYTIVMVLMLAVLYPSRYTEGSMIYGVFIWYALAKLLEFGDRAVFGAGGLVSGHTLKHLASGLATFWVLRMLTARRALAAGAIPA